MPPGVAVTGPILVIERSAACEQIIEVDTVWLWLLEEFESAFGETTEALFCTVLGQPSTKGTEKFKV